MTIQAKICGITTPDTARAVAQAGASHIGFNFFPKSPRYLEISDAADLALMVPSGLTRVGVFVNPDDDFLSQAIAALSLDMVQLHGSESVDRVRDVQTQFGLPVIKAMPVAQRSDVTASVAYDGVADCVLFDAKAPKDDDAMPGGMGRPFDWTLLRDLPLKGPWALSGGLSPDNVAEAIRATGCTFVDVSSGVETQPGVKSAAKIAAFMDAIKDTAS
ncbi:MAG: phosphoribosylanthranilate isomerase [Alphaproteobacteria bacterium]|nr:MAG: phosphoribosylanthranilate isomerase [Alphaproteobacteria bacterium]